MDDNRKLEQTVRLFDLVAGADKLYRLGYPNRWLVPVSVEADEENATFTYDLNELTSVQDFAKEMDSEKLRLLTNIAGLFSISAEYSFSLEPANIYVDRNLEPKILFRDLCGEDNKHDFVEEYKALAGCLLEPKYSFEDYLCGGNGLYKKKKRLQSILSATTVEQIETILNGLFQQENSLIKTKKILVDRKRYRAIRILMPVFLALFLLGCGLAWYLNFVALPYQEALVTAGHAFLHEDYDTAIETLQSVDPLVMPKEERYQLARAYIISESLSQVQKQNILSGITLKTEDNLLVYWIQLGRLAYDDAIDTAKRIGDDELLLYALVKQEVAVQNDNTLTGEEKSTLLSGLNQQTEALRKKQEEKASAVAEASAAVPATESSPQPERVQASLESSADESSVEEA